MDMAVSFKRARKAESKLRMALSGPSGSGKTYSALAIATALAGPSARPGENGVAVIDTERGSASKYSDVFAFDVLELDSFHPDRYIEAIQAAEAAGYRVLVIDSITHEWRGKDGILEQVDRISKLNKMPSIQVWAQATPMHNRFVDAMLAASLHVIVTMRSKTGTHIDKDERGKVTVQKVGMEAEQRDGIEYEFDVVGDLDRDNTLVISKSRCSALAGQMIRKPGAEIAATLAEWLHGDEAETPASTASPGKPAPQEPVADEATRHQSTAQPQQPQQKPATPKAASPAPATAGTPAAGFATTDGCNPLADAPLRKRMNALNIRSIDEVETFLARVKSHYTQYTRQAIENELIEMEARTKAANLREAFPAGTHGAN